MRFKEHYGKVIGINLRKVQWQIDAALIGRNPAGPKDSKVLAFRCSSSDNRRMMMVRMVHWGADFKKVVLRAVARHRRNFVENSCELGRQTHVGDRERERDGYCEGGGKDGEE